MLVDLRGFSEGTLFTVTLTVDDWDYVLDAAMRDDPTHLERQAINRLAAALDEAASELRTQQPLGRPMEDPTAEG